MDNPFKKKRRLAKFAGGGRASADEPEGTNTYARAVKERITGMLPVLTRTATQMRTLPDEGLAASSVQPTGNIAGEPVDIPDIPAGRKHGGKVKHKPRGVGIAKRGYGKAGK